MRRAVVCLFTLALISAACGDDGDTSDPPSTTAAPPPSTTDAPPPPSTTAALPPSTTEAPPSVTAADLAEIGPYPVGVTTRELATGNLVEIWYPAGPDAEGQTEVYSLRDFTPSLIRDLVPADLDDRVTVAAARDATVSTDGPHPLVLFSHGAAGFRNQSTNYTHHLASWGFVVASADHPSRSFESFVDGPEDPQPATDDIDATIAMLEDDDMLVTAIDMERIGLSGHSAGGGTILAATATRNYAGYVSLASGAGDDSTLPDIPSMFMAGALDGVADPSRTRAAFDRAASPSWYLEFEAAGHNAFNDLCAIGDNDAGIMSVFVAAGLDSLLTDGLRALAEDGCLEPNRPVRSTWPGIHQAATGFFRFVFGIDADPIGLDAPAADGVTVDAK